MDEIEGFWLWLTGCATSVRGPSADDPRTLDQRRSDVLADIAARGLVQSLTHTGAALPRSKGRRPQIGVVVAASTLLGLDEEPGELRVWARSPRRWPAGSQRTAPGVGCWSTRDRPAGRGVRRHLRTAARHGRPRRRPRRHLPRHRMSRRCSAFRHRPHPSLAGRSDSDQQPGRQASLPPHGEDARPSTTVRTEPDGTTVWTLPSGRTYRVPPPQVIDHPALDPPVLRDAMRDWREAIRRTPTRRHASRA